MDNTCKDPHDLCTGPESCAATAKAPVPPFREGTAPAGGMAGRGEHTVRPERDGISVYIHIPFCLRKCRYCDFLSGPGTEAVREEYVRALVSEILCQSPSGADTVFFGGGTPSVLTGDQVLRIMEALGRVYRIRSDAEISMEMNPGTADADKLRAFRKAGINRLSMGVQSMRDEELRMLGRIHTAAQAREAFDMAREAGFDNINIDLMSALPGQTFETWADTLAQAVRWDPEHISAYSLIIEPGTPFAQMYEAGTLPPLPDEETDRDMYRYTGTFLEAHGYGRYEISNYAKPGRESRHNSGYWTGRSYIGFGIGAASFVDGVRYSNITDLEDYLRILQDPAGTGQDLGRLLHTDIHPLTEEEKMEEFMFLGLRLTAGVREADFAARFGRTMDSVYGKTIRKHIAQGLVERTQAGVCLTERGIDISNYVLADYLLS